MSTETITALCSLCGTAFGSVAGILASSRLVNYRLEQLEKKVEKHNQVVERTYKLEARMDEAERRLRGTSQVG